MLGLFTNKVTASTILFIWISNSLMLPVLLERCYLYGGSKQTDPYNQDFYIYILIERTDLRAYYASPEGLLEKERSSSHSLLLSLSWPFFIITSPQWPRFVKLLLSNFGEGKSLQSFPFTFPILVVFLTSPLWPTFIDLVIDSLCNGWRQSLAP